MDRLFFAGTLEKRFGFELARRIVILSICSVVTPLLLILFGVEALVRGFVPLAILDFSLGAVVLLNYLLSRLTRRYELHTSLLTVLLGGHFSYIFLTGGVGSDGYLWYYSFPLIATFLLGSRRGLALSLVMLLPATVLFAMAPESPRFVAYAGDFKVRFIISYLMVSGLTYILEISRERQVSEVLASNSRLQDLDRLKSMFMASMSHELRTPLNAIIGFTGIMLKGMAGEVNKEQERQLTFVKENADNLRHLIEDVIDVSKIETGRIEISREEFSLREVLDEAVRTLRPVVDREAAELRVRCPAELRLQSNRRRVRQVVLNLLSNALKAAGTGPVEIRAAEKGGEVSVEVEDWGIGISRQHQDRLFQPFQRLPGSERSREGTGLGLYLSRKIAELLGGDIRVRSETGAGSTFTLTLPKERLRSPETGGSATPSA